MKKWYRFAVLVGLGLFVLSCSFLDNITDRIRSQQKFSESPTPVVIIETPLIAVKTPDESLLSATSTSTPKLDTPLTVVETPTATTLEVLPSPTTQPLLPRNLAEITTDNLQNLQVLGEIPYLQVKPDHNIYFMKLSHDGSKLVVISENWGNRKRALVVWDLISNSQVMEIDDPPYSLWGASFSPDDGQLWVFREAFLDQYDLQEGLLVNTIDFPPYDRGAAAISPDGNYVVTGVFHGEPETSSIQFYHFGGEEPFHTEEIAYMILSFHFSPDSKMVAGTSARIGATVKKIWDIESGAVMKDLYDYDGGPVFSSHSKLAAFVKGENMSVFSIESWVLRSTFNNGTPSSPNAPQFFLGGDQILVIKEYNDVTFNDVNTGEELLRLPGEWGLVDVSPMSNIIITYQNRGGITFWGISQ